MIRLLFPLCLVAAMCGCSDTATAPAKTTGGGAAPAATGTSAPRDAANKIPSAATAEDKAEPAEEKVADAKEPAAVETKPVPAEEPKTEPATTKLPEPDEEPATETAQENTEPAAEDTKEDKGPKTVDEAIAALQRARTPQAITDLGTALEALLEKEPDHAEGLVTMAQVSQFLARQAGGGEAAGPSYLKSADFIKRAMKAKPELAENEGARQFAAIALYNGACAQAKDKKIPEAMVTLRESVDFGFKDMKLLSTDEDLTELRALPEFEAFLTEAKEKIKLAVQKEVAHLLETNEPFEFNFELNDIGGNAISKGALAGKVLIVDIWGTWCPPCRMEIPHFVELDKNYREKGLQIVGLNRERAGDDEEAAKLVKEFCDNEGVTYPCALITEEIMNQVPDFQGFPTTLFIDRTGKVRLKAVGYHDLDFLTNIVETLLAEKAPEAAGG